MSIKLEAFNKLQLKSGVDEIRSGDTVRIHQKIRGEKNQEKIQVFEGLVIARKHGKGISATITVRKVISGIGVEKIIPVHSPLIEKIEILKRGKARRAKLYYLRTAKGKKTKLKKKKFTEAIVEKTFEEKPGEESEEIKKPIETTTEEK